MVKVHVDGEPVNFHGPPDTPLLWLLRDYLGLPGAKYGCGMSPALAPAVADTLFALTGKRARTLLLADTKGA